MSAAFGGGGGGLLGSKTGDFLTWVTIVMVGVFLSLAVLLAKYYKPPPASASAPQLSAPEQSLPPAGAMDAAGDANSGADADSPGTR